MPRITPGRRHFLRSSTALLALPLLPSLGHRRFTRAADVTSRPKRLVFLAFGWGVTEETWFPDVKQIGASYTLPPGLAPLARHKVGITIVQGTSNKFANEAHWGSTFWLTGANRYAEPGQSFCNRISVDQVAAAHLGRDTRFASLQLDAPEAHHSGHGPGLSLAWDANGKPIGACDTPVAAFHKLFSADTVPLAERQAMLREKRSILDALDDDLTRVRRGLSKEDTDKVGEYAQSIRDIETRLGREERWLDVPKAKAAFAEPKPSLAGKAEIEMMYDLIIAALRTDTTRVATYRQPVDSLLKSIGVTLTGHDLSHYSQGDRMEGSQTRDAAQSELFAGFLDRLKSVKEPDGTSLFDHTSVAFGSNIRSVHYLTNCPTVLAGGGARIRMGQHLVLPKDTPLCNVWLTLLHGLGHEAVRHGDSTGVVKELMS